jgi:hypothetical protein
MTDQNTNALATQTDVPKKIVTPEIQKSREWAIQLKHMIVNGNKLTDPEIYALANYAGANGLNPFAGECYYLPGVGPCPGVAGWRSKAQDQLDMEAKTAGQQGGNLWCEYFHTEPGDCNFEPERGDIAYKVVMHDSVSRKRWTDSIKDIAVDFVKAGVPFFDAFEKARELIGAEPVTISWGVIFASESFGAPGKAEKFDRHERAKKRGEKLCLRKRFPRIHLPEPENYSADTVDAEDVRIVMEEPKREVDPNFDADKAIEEMGFGGPEKPQLNRDLEIACQEKDGKGRLYSSLATGELRFHLKGIRAKGEKATEQDSIHAQALEMIIAARESGVLEEPGAKQPPLVK